MGIFTALLYWLLPLSFFYSRIGLPDMLILGLCSLSFVFFLQSRKQKIYAYVSGILFSLMLLINTSALILLLFPAMVFLVWPGLFGKPLRIMTKTMLVTTGLPSVIFWVWYIRTLSNQHEFLLLSNFPKLFDYSIKNHDYLKNFVSYLSFPVGLGFILGLGYLMKVVFHERKHLYSHSLFKNPLALVDKDNLKTWRLKLKSLINLRLSQKLDLSYEAFSAEVSILLLIPAVLYNLLFGFSPRDFLFLLFPVALILGLVIDKFIPKLKWLFLILIVPWTFYSWQGTLDPSINQVKIHLDSLMRNNDSLPIYATFEPETLSHILGYPIKLLSPEALNGGIIISETQATSILENTNRPEYLQSKQVLSQIPSRKLSWVYTDLRNYYPMNNVGNVFKIYFIPQRLDSDSPEDVQLYLPFN